MKKVYNSLANTAEGNTLHPPSDAHVRSFLCPFFTLIKPCCTRALELSSLVPDPKAKSSSEIKSLTLKAMTRSAETKTDPPIKKCCSPPEN